MEQGSKEWLDWRRQGIGASEMAAVLGKCPYKTAYQLWCEKTATPTEKDEQNADLMARGHAVEAQTRAAFEFSSGLDFPPALFEHPTMPFLRASLDGWNEETRQPIEIKMVGTEKLTTPIPEHHLIQVQTQMLVTGSDSLFYVRSTDGINIHAETIHADEELQRRIAVAATLFWEMVEAKVPPQYEGRDWVPVDDSVLAAALRQLQGLKGKVRDAARGQVFAGMAHRRVVCQGIKVDSETRRIVYPKEA
jgi:putative phage-type endonuclease